jgi:iron-sulfur cluster assembly protein
VNNAAASSTSFREEKGTGMINVTEKAVNEIKRIKGSDPTATNANLRVQVAGGGCSGMSYKLGFDNEPAKPSDKVFELGGPHSGAGKLIIDAKSFLYLSGTTLDFSDGLNGTGFVFQNPNAKRTCGCGSSFSV